MKTFKIGNDRSLKLSKKNDSISVEDKGTKKAAHFTPARWASFLVSRSNRRPAAQAVRGRGRGILHALRWRMARVVDQGFLLCRPTKILHTHGPDRVETYKVAYVQAGCRQTTPRQPDCHKLHTLLPQPGSHHSRDHRDLSRVQSVSFNHRVTVYPADDYDRKRPWMYIARRRQQFTLRIQQMELILAPILDDEHRLKIRMRHLAFADIVL